MKSIAQAKDLVEFVKSAEFYNKIQVTSEGKTQTFWYLKDDSKWIAASEDGESGDISEEGVMVKLQDLNDDSQVVVAGNDTSGVLTYKF